MTARNDIKDYIRTVPNFPKPGIQFRDVTTLFANAEGFRTVLEQMVAAIDSAGVDIIAGIDARGFILGGALADRLSLGFVPVRKKGKLPAETLSQDYVLEYGTETLELHKDALHSGQRVLLVDDLIATGGTALAAASLIRRLGATVAACAFIVDLPDLGGSERLQQAGYKVISLCQFGGD